ncbi:hypothetical protein Hanom_Chr02g00099051 [Helianthus anomalus]
MNLMASLLIYLYRVDGSLQLRHYHRLSLDHHSHHLSLRHHLCRRHRLCQACVLQEAS